MAEDLTTSHRACIAALFLAILAGTPAAAHEAPLPVFDLAKTCADFRDFGTPSQRDIAYQGCLQDETNARATLRRNWTAYKLANKRACVVQGPDKSYVEMLTCLSLAAFPDEQ